MRHNTRMSDDRGVVVPLLALSLVALMTVAALVIDGGQAYSQRRQMQNAADAAAMAGTAVLDDLHFTVPRPPAATWDDVEAEVQRISLNTNGAEDILVCAIIDSNANEIGPCSEESAVMHADAAGVSVRVRDTRDTFFGGVVGVDTMSATADAAAAVQPVAGVEAPWAFCSSGGKYDILDPVTLKVDPIKAVAAGVVEIQGAQTYKDDEACAAKEGGGGGAASFKGPIDDEIVQVGDNIISENDPGNNLPTGWQDYRKTCPLAPMTLDCILLPIAVSVVDQGTNAQIYITDFAFFRVWEPLPPAPAGVQLVGKYEGPAGPTDTIGLITGDGQPDPNQARTVTLVE